MNNNEALEHIGPAIETPYIPPPGKGFIQKFWQFWESLKLTVTLLTIITLAILVGTIIPQNHDFGEYVILYGPAMAELFRILGFFDIYKTGWFTFLLTMLCISTSVCTAHRYRMLKRSLGNPTTVMKEEFYTQSEYRVEELFPGKQKDIIEKLEKSFKKFRFKSFREESNGTVYLYGQKGLLNRWGNLFAHIAVVLVFVGGLIGKTVWPWSYDETLPIVEGQTVTVAPFNFQMRLDKFQEKYYPGSSDPSDFRSDVTVFENGVAVKKAIIRVNYPLKYKGILFYQNSRAKSGEINGFELMINDGKTFSPITTWKGRVGETIDLPGTDKSIQIARYLSDFGMDENMQPVSRSNEPNNPAFEIIEYTKEQQTGHGWVFANISLRDLPMKQNISFDYAVSSLDQSWVSIFQVVKDPGVPVVYVGFTLLIFGLITTMWLEYRRVWIRLNPKENGTLVQAFGASNRRATDIDKDIKKLLEFAKKQ